MSAPYNLRSRGSNTGQGTGEIPGAFNHSMTGDPAFSPPPLPDSSELSLDDSRSEQQVLPEDDPEHSGAHSSSRIPSPDPSGVHAHGEEYSS
ncbi:hypothetical protein EIP91_006466, partial [Steccherinum ochraceum]